MAELYGLAGVARAGKDATAAFLESELGFKRTYMSEPLERALLALDPLVPIPECLAISMNLMDPWPSELGAASLMRYREIHARVGYDSSKEIPEVRALLQRLGTEVGRDIISPTVWLDVAERRVAEWMAAGYDVVVTGIRFPNELEMIHRHNGEVVWIERGLAPVNGHVSDHLLTRSDCDWTLANDGTLEDLRLNVTLFKALHAPA